MHAVSVCLLDGLVQKMKFCIGLRSQRALRNSKILLENQGDGKNVSSLGHSH